jgi:hypothetical protein
MPDPEEISVRAFGMMQALAEAYADGAVPDGPQRGIVGRRSAMDAVMQLFAVIDEEVEAERIPEESALHAMAMLMLVREYVLPLPDPPGDEQVLRDDLAALTQMLDDEWTG